MKRNIDIRTTVDGKLRSCHQELRRVYKNKTGEYITVLGRKLYVQPGDYVVETVRSIQPSSIHDIITSALQRAK